MHRVSFALVAGFFALNAVGQIPSLPDEGLRAVKDAIARGDLPLARERLAALPRSQEPAGQAERDLLDAAVAPRGVRTKRLLAVAATHSSEPVGLTALVAAMGHSLPEVLAYPGKDDPADRDGPQDEPSLADLAMACQPLVVAWEAKDAANPEVAFARDLLTRLLIGNHSDHLSELRILANTPIPVPRPLAEPMNVLAFPGPVDDEASLEPWIHGRPPTAAVLDLQIASEGPPAIPALPPGRYVLEVRSLRTGFRSLRRLLVSDLDIAVQCSPTSSVVLATVNGAPAPGAKIAITPPSTPEAPVPPLSAVTDAQGLAWIDHPGAVWTNAEVSATFERDGGQHRARTQIHRHYEEIIDRRYTTHLMVERPLVRPGETLPGRVLIRQHQAPNAPAAREEGRAPQSSSAASQPIALRIHVPGQEPEVRKATADADGIHAFEVNIPRSAPPGGVMIEAFLPIAMDDPSGLGFETFPDGSRWHQLVEREVAELREFVKPPLFLSMAGPSSWKQGEADPVLTVSATYPTGTPAVGQRGTLQFNLGPYSHRETFALDARGEAQTTLALSSLALKPTGHSVQTTVSVTAPDGQTLTARHSVSIAAPANPAGAADPQPSEDLSIRFERPSTTWRDGEEIAILLSGPAHTAVLVTAVRTHHMEARAVVLDARGQGRASFLVRSSWAPEVTFQALTPRSSGDRPVWRRRRSFGNSALTLIAKIQPRAERLELVVTPGQPVYRPGEEAEVRLAVKDEEGQPHRGTVCLAVVDETLFSLEEDRTPEPRSALTPPWFATQNQTANTEGPGSPWLALGEVLKEGGVPEPMASAAMLRLGGGGGGSYGGRGGGKSADAPIRKNFRSSAAWFAKIPVGSDGLATVRFKLPDNLTRWRITAVMVDDGRGAALTKAEFRTALPVSTNPLLPRFLRVGDRAELEVRVDQEGKSALRGTLATSIEGDASGPAVRRDLEIPALGSALGVIAVQADRVGQARWSAAFEQDGVALDRTELSLPISSDTTEDVFATTEMLESALELSLAIPKESRVVRRELEVMGSLEAMLTESSNWLTDYPYGCAEQTASRLVPLFVASHARLARVLGGADLRPELDAAAARRLETGLARLRSLQQADGGFAWWAGNQSDRLVSALVLRTLTMAVEAKIRTEPYGVRLSHLLPIVKSAAGRFANPDPAQNYGLTAPSKAVTRRHDRHQLDVVADAEIVAAALLLGGGSRELVAAGKNLAVVPHLPTGLAARLGFGLARAGEGVAARRLAALVTERLQSNEFPSRAPWLAESRASVLAASLDLIGEVEPDSPLRATIIGGLLRRFAKGELDHTFGTAATVLALSRERVRHPELGGNGEGVLAIRTAEGSTEHRIKEQKGAQRIELPVGTGPVSMQRRGGPAPIVSLRLTTSEPAATAAARWSPIRVTRALLRQSATTEGKPELVATEGSLEQGELYFLRLSIEAPPDLSYLLADCPLPAGFEVASSHSAYEVRDDRVSIGIPALPESGKLEFEIPLIPAIRGRFVWPPSTVFAMYEPELRGRSAGASVEVKARTPKAGLKSQLRILDHDSLQVHAQALMRRTLEELKNGTRKGLDEVGRWPTTSPSEWLRNDFVSAAGSRLLDDEELGRAWVRALGGDPKVEYRGAALANLKKRIGAPDFAEKFASILADSGFGTYAASTLTTTEDGSLDRRLYRLVALRSQTVDTRKSALAQYATLVHTYLGGKSPAGLTEDKVPFLLALFQVRAGKPEGEFADWPVALRDAAIASAFVRDAVATVDDSSVESGQEILAITNEVVDVLRQSRLKDPRLAAALTMQILGTPTWPERGAARPEVFDAITTQFAKRRALVWAEISRNLLPWLDEFGADDTPYSRILGSLSEKERQLWIEQTLPALGRYLPKPKPSEAALGVLVLERLDSEAAAKSQSLLLQLFLSGVPEWRGRASQHLSPASMASLPVSVLIRELQTQGGIERCLEEIGRRDLGTQRAAIDQSDVLQDEDLLARLAEVVKPEALVGRPLNRLLALASALAAQGRGNDDSRAAILRALVASGDVDGLGRMLASPQHPTARALLLRAFLQLGGKNVAWQSDDPGRQDWIQRLAAFQGSGPALAALRTELLSGNPPPEVATQLWWILARHAQFEDLLTIPLGTTTAEPAVLENLLGRVRSDEILARWRAPWDGEGTLDTILRHAPASLIAELLPSAIKAFPLERGGTGTVIARAEASLLLPRLMLLLPNYEPKAALRLLDVISGDPVKTEAVSAALLEHSAPRVRQAAASTLHRLTGIAVPYRGPKDEPLIADAENDEDARKAGLVRLRREGLAAANSGASPRVRRAAALLGIHLN